MAGDIGRSVLETGLSVATLLLWVSIGFLAHWPLVFMAVGGLFAGTGVGMIWSEDVASASSDDDA